MAALSSSTSSTIILRRVFRPPLPTAAGPSILSFFLLKPPLTSPVTTTFCSAHVPSRLPLVFSHSLSSSSSPPPPHSLSIINSDTETPLETEDDSIESPDGDDDDDIEIETVDGDLKSENETISGGSERSVDASFTETNKKLAAKLQSLTVKEKKSLASYAHSLGKKLKSQQVGKSGVTDSVAVALVETLEANELLKVKVHGSCPSELGDAVKKLEESTGSIAVSRIGRTVILYRPSPTKLKAEEKKQQARRVFVRKQFPTKPSFQDEERSGRGRRGISRF